MRVRSKSNLELNLIAILTYQVHLSHSILMLTHTVDLSGVCFPSQPNNSVIEVLLNAD